MASVNTNIAATTALRTLQQTNKTLDATQNRISTGYKIGEAKDNAAYWAISTTLKSDNAAMSTVKDALGLGAATVDVAYQGLNKAKEVLDEIKKKLTAATQDGIDKTKIQAEVASLQDQLKSIASSSSFSGENWLSENTSGTASVVASFTRGDNNVVNIGRITIDTSAVELVRTGSSSNGILTKDITSSADGNLATTGVTLTLANAKLSATTDVFTFNVKLGNGPTSVVTLNNATYTSLGMTSTNATSSVDDYSRVINKALADAGVTGVVATADLTSNTGIKFVSSQTVAVTFFTPTGAGSPTSLANMGFSANATTKTSSPTSSVIQESVLGISIDNSTTLGTLNSYIDIVSKATDQVIDAASKLGAIASRIDLQQTFVNTLMDTIDKGVSGLIDADMSEESTKLQALQVKQQLGTQALSIANSSAQNILSLFQN